MTAKQIIPMLMEAADQIRVFHWQTKSYAEHKALGAFYDALSAATDDFAETLIGIDGARPVLKGEIKIEDYAKGAPQSYIKAFAKEISGWKDMTTDILNMRDSLLGEAHHALYLLSLE